MANPALASTASAAFEQVSGSDDLPSGDKIIVADAITGGVFEFDPLLELDGFTENLLDSVHDDSGIASTAGDSIMDDHSSIADSRTSAASVTEKPKSSQAKDREDQKKAKKSTKSTTNSVAESSTSNKDAEKKEKSEKKKSTSPSSLAESVMSTKSGEGDKSREKKPTKPKVKKEPEPEKTWAFVRAESMSN